MPEPSPTLKAGTLELYLSWAHQGLQMDSLFPQGQISPPSWEETPYRKWLSRPTHCGPGINGLSPTILLLPSRASLPQTPALFSWEFIKDKSIWFHTSRTRKNNTELVTGPWADAPATLQYRWRLWFYWECGQDPENWHPILSTAIPMGLPRLLGKKDEEVTTSH